MVGDVERDAFGLLRDAGVARRADEPVDQRAGGELPGQRVLASAGAEEENVHAAQALARGQRRRNLSVPAIHSVHTRLDASGCRRGLLSAMKVLAALLLFILGSGRASGRRRLHAGKPARGGRSRAASSTRRPIRRASAPPRSGRRTPAGATASRACTWKMEYCVGANDRGRVPAASRRLRPVLPALLPRPLGRPAARLFRLGQLPGRPERHRLVSRSDVRKARRPLPLQRYRFPPARAAADQHHAGAARHRDGARHHVVPRRRARPVDRLARPDRRHLRDLPDPDRGPRRPPDRPRLRRADHLARRRHLRRRLRELCVRLVAGGAAGRRPPSWAPATSC